MKMMDDQHLLAEYRQNGSDAAFRELVEHFLDLVYSAALRPRFAFFSTAAF